MQKILIYCPGRKRTAVEPSSIRSDLQAKRAAHTLAKSFIIHPRAKIGRIVPGVRKFCMLEAKDDLTNTSACLVTECRNFSHEGLSL